MITVGGKLWLGISAFAVAALVAWQGFSGGEERGLLVLLGLASAALIVGALLVWIRDGEVTAAVQEEERATTAAATSGPIPAPWPAIGAFGVALTVVGLATGGALLYAGFGVVAVAVVEWMVQGWAERATSDAGENAELRNRIMYPFEIPVIGLLVVGLVLLAFSRVLLSLPKSGSTIAAIVVASAILLVAVVVAARPRVSSGVLTGVLVLGAVALLGGGIVGAVAGEREIEEHEAEEHSEAVEPETRPNDPESETDDGGETGDEAEEGGGGTDRPTEQSENPDAPDAETEETTEVSSP